MMESSSFQPSVRRTTMKMASVSVVSAFLLCCSAVASQGCDLYAATGRSINVRLGYTMKSDDSLKWKFKDQTIFHKKSSHIIAGKTADINDDGSFKLTNLKKDQEGVYTPEVFNSNGKSQKTVTTHLCIRDPVKKPKVNAICEDKNVIFKCIPDNTSKYEIKKYEWLQNTVQTKKTVPTLKLVTAETKNIKFACNISNEVSFEISEPVTHNCAKIGIPGLPEEVWGISIWVFVGGGGGIVILLIITVIVCCVQTKRTRKLRLKDEEELRLEWTSTSHHPNHPPLPNHPPPHHPNRHHHHQHHKQQQQQQQQQQKQQQQQQEQQQAPGNTGPRQSRSKQNRQPRARAPEPNSQPQPSPRRTGQAQKPASDTDDEQPPPLPQPRKKGPKTQLD